MSLENLKTVYRRWIDEVWNEGNVAVINDLHAPDYIDHSGLAGVEPTSEGLKRFITEYHKTFPDGRFSIDDVIAEGDRVVGRYTFQGTHLGNLGNLPPTGKSVTMHGIDILRVADGRIAEIWHLEDVLSVFQQLGVMPG